MSDDRPPVYWEDGVLVIRASAIGTSCLWELVAAGQGYEQGPVPDWLQRAFDEGTQLEPVILARLEVDHGIEYASHQDEGELRIDDTLIIRYHSDGLGYLRPHELRVIEAKALTNELWHRAVRHGVGSVMDEYPWQLSVMMHGEGLPGLWVAYNKGTSPVNEMGDRELCLDEGKIYVQSVPEPPIPLSDIVAKALQVRELVLGDDILESGRPCDSPDHFPCRYLHIRPEVVSKASTVVEVSGPDSADFDQHARAYLYNKGLADEAANARDKARDAILELAGEDASKVVTDKYVIPIVNGRGPSKLALDEMTAEDRAVYDRLMAKYTRPGKTTRFLRSVKGRA